MGRYAELFDALHMVVFSLRSHNLSYEKASPQLHFHPTHTPLRTLHVPVAFFVGRRILNATHERKGWVITTQDPFEAGVVGWLLSVWYKIPLVVQEHGDVFSTPHWRRESLLNRVRYVVGCFILKRADCVRVVSERSKRGLIALCIEEAKISVLPVRTEVSSFARAVSDPDIRARWGKDTAIVLSMGRHVRQKNLPMLLDAFAAVHRTHPKTHLVLVGHGPESLKLQQRATMLGLGDAVTFLPWTDTVAALMKSADVYALSSNYEGWGRVLIEAMGAGVPSVTTDVGCVGEVFFDGRHGRVVPVGDVRAFADALAELIADTSLRQEYGERAARDVENVFMSEEEHTKGWGDILMRCGREGVV